MLLEDSSMRYFLNCSYNYVFDFLSIFSLLDDSMLNIEHHKILWMKIMQLYTKTSSYKTIDHTENNNFHLVNILHWNILHYNIGWDVDEWQLMAARFERDLRKKMIQFYSAIK